MCKEDENNKEKNKAGFTLVELSLAIAFLGVLLIAIAVITTNMIAIFQKGVTVKSVNTAGLSIVDDVKRNLSRSDAENLEVLCEKKYSDANIKELKSIFSGSSIASAIINAIANTSSFLDKKYKTCLDDHGGELISQEVIGEIDGKNVPLYGVICTGEYSYVWNSGYIIRKNDPSKAAFIRGMSKDKIPRLYRVKDTRREVCLSTAYLKPVGLKYVAKVPDDGYYGIAESYEDGVDLLGNDSDSNLGVYDFTIYPSSSSGASSIFYSGSFTLGTANSETPVDITASGNYCKPEAVETLSSTFSYCAINRFNFGTRALIKSL